MSTVLLIFKITGIAVGALLGLIILEMITAVFAPWIKAPRQPLPSQTKPESRAPEYRQDIRFDVNGIPVHAWLYLPSESACPAPCVIMSNGFGGTKDMALPAYAQRFVREGMAVLTYDYRHFGESGGEPRQLFDPGKQLDDLRAAVRFARGRREINPDRIALWGTSAAGGYGLVIAAEDKQIACVIAQCPSLDRHADFKKSLQENGLGFFLRLFVHAQRDKGRSRLGMPPHRLPIVGKPGTLAMHTGQDVFQGYTGLAAGSSTFTNTVCARVLLIEDKHNPANYAEQVQCPFLLVLCEQDHLVDNTANHTVADKMRELATVRIFPVNHFDIYQGDWFEQDIAEQISFLNKQL